MDLLDSGLLVEHLASCLKDTYESNQQKALQLINTVPRDEGSIDPSLTLRRAFEYLYSSRTQDSMSAAYLFLSAFTIPNGSLSAIRDLNNTFTPSETYLSGLLSDVSIDSSDKGNNKEELSLLLIGLVLNILEQQGTEAKKDLIDASQRYPLYPSLLCLRYLIRSADMSDVPRWRSVISKLFDVTFNQIYPIVHPVVCHSSPEGYLPPDDGEEEPGDNSSKRPGLPQFLVVCCWRTIKEISLVYGTLMEKVVPQSTDIVTYQQICDYIKVFYESILLNAKHRGAFEMAYTGYCSYWHTVWRLECYHSLVSEFLSDSPYSMLLNKETADSLCATRRSAGLPFMVQAYVTSEPKLNNNAALKRIFSDLLPISAYTPESEPKDLFTQVQRVHALNVLRALYRVSSLGDAVQPFVGRGLKSAVQGYQSQIWPVRNASTLLFSALITRMFGVKHGKDDLSKQSGMAGRLFFQKYPEIQPFLLQEMKTCTIFSADGGKTLLQPNLYLLLIVLCKLYPSQRESTDPSLSLEVFVPYVHRCAASPVYKARMLAALALANIVNHDPLSIKKTISYLCEEIRYTESSNTLHGLLLQTRHLYSSLITSPSAADTSIYDFTPLVELLTQSSNRFLESSCELVISTYTDIVRLCKPNISYTLSDTDKVLHFFHTVLFGTHTQRNADWLNIWSSASVDLQLSKCRLVLDLHEPVMCTELILSDLLSVYSMYEIHHEVLRSAVVSQEHKMLSVETLTATITSMMDQNDQKYSYSTSQTIYMLLCQRLVTEFQWTSDLPQPFEWTEHCCFIFQLANVISRRISTDKDIDINLLESIYSTCCRYYSIADSPLPILRLLASCIRVMSARCTTACMQSSDLDEITAQVLDLLRGDDMDVDGQGICLDIISYLSGSVPTTISIDQRKETTSRLAIFSYYSSCILLLLGMDDHIRLLAAGTVSSILNNDGVNVETALAPQDTLSSLLDWMSSKLPHQEVLSIWEQWQDVSFWSVQSLTDDDQQQDEEGDRLFGKAEGALLCDPDLFHEELRRKCVNLKHK